MIFEEKLHYELTVELGRSLKECLQVLKKAPSSPDFFFYREIIELKDEIHRLEDSVSEELKEIEKKI